MEDISHPAPTPLTTATLTTSPLTTPAATTDLVTEEDSEDVADSSDTDPATSETDTTMDADMLAEPEPTLESTAPTATDPMDMATEDTAPLESDPTVATTTDGELMAMPRVEGRDNSSLC